MWASIVRPLEHWTTAGQSGLPDDLTLLTKVLNIDHLQHTSKYNILMYILTMIIMMIIIPDETLGIIAYFTVIVLNLIKISNNVQIHTQR